jgi:hypothetical protein
MPVKLFFTLFFAFTFLILSASKDSTHTKPIKVVALPVVFYQPETKWGFGVAGLLRFKQKSEPDSSRHSNVTFAFTDTQLNQIVFSAPYQLWFKRETYNIYGELGYQKENYLFFGTGNNVPSYFHERYYVKVPRFQINALKKFYPHFYAGLKYAIDYNTFTQFNDTGLLIKGTIPGSKGGYISGGGAVIKYDNRDNQFYATKGYYVEFVFLSNSPVLGSNYRFDKYSLNMSTYVALPYKQVLAFNAYALANAGNVPFYQMATLGGDTRMRGLYNGRYRDKDCWILQTEYRLFLFWRIGVSLFAGIGNVAAEINQFNLKYTRVAYGGGIRALIDKKQHLNIRFDAGLSNGNVNYYFTIGEAF